MNWFVYIILCDDDSLYTGITTDTDRRFQEHLDSKLGARYFNGRKPIEIIYSETGHDRSSALKREAAIKKLSRRQKQQLVASGVKSISG